MIVVDTSALMAIVLEEPSWEACFDALLSSEPILISAATVAEALVVASRRKSGDIMERLLARAPLTVVMLTEAGARLAAQAYDRWGKGVHPARLNFADCFAYALAKEHDCPLLYVGDDFAQTDIVSALA